MARFRFASHFSQTLISPLTGRYSEGASIKLSISTLILGLFSFSVQAIGFGRNNCDYACGDLLETITFGQPILVIVYLLLLIFGMIKLYGIYEKSDFANSMDLSEQVSIGLKYLIVIIGGLYLLTSL